MPRQSVLQHGRLGGEGLHATATPSKAGFMSADDKRRLDDLWANQSSGLSGGVTQLSEGAGISLTPNPIVATGTVALESSGVTPGTYGDATNVAQVTVDTYGRVTVAANVAIAGAGGDNITVNAVSVTDANLNNTTPVPPGGSLNVFWQRSGSGPDQVSAYIEVPSLEPLLTLNNLAGTLSATKGGTAQAAWTQGDMLYASAANTLSRLGIGAANRAIVSNGTIPTWATIVNSFIGRTGGVVAAASDYDASQVDNDSKAASAAGYDAAFVDDALDMVSGNVRGWRFYDEFIGSGRFSAQYIWTVSTLAGSTSGAIQAYGGTKHPGVSYLNPGTTAGQVITAHVGQENILLGGGWTYFEVLLTLEALSGAASTPAYTVFVGFGNATPGGSAVGFFYDVPAAYLATGGSANWWVATRSGGGAWSGTDTGTAAKASGTAAWDSANDQRLRFEVNAAASEVKFYIDGVLEHTTSTSIPTADEVGILLMVEKDGASVDDVYVYFDYIEAGGLITLTGGERA